MPLQQYPFRLFTEIMSGNFEEIVSTKRCCLDAFSKDFLQAFPTTERLASSLCMIVVTSLLSMMDLNTYSTERIHSKSQRRQRSKRQTHVGKVAELAAWHQSYAMFGWLCTALHARADNGPGSCSQHLADLLESFSALDRKDNENAGPALTRNSKKVKKKKRKRGGGGAYDRAFIHEASLQGRLRGCKGFPRWLKAEFQALAPEARQQYQLLGRRASRAHASAGLALPKRSVRNPPASSSARPEGEHEPELSVDAVERAVKMALPPSIVELCHLEDALAAARKSLPKLTEHGTAVDPYHLRACCAHILDEGKERLRTMAPWVPNHPGMNSVFLPHSCPAVALQMSMQCMVSKRKPTLPIEALAQQWQQQHVGIIPKGRHKAAKLKVSFCQAAGTCWCGREAAPRRLFYHKCLNALKTLLSAEGVKQKSSIGLVVLAFQSSDPGDTLANNLFSAFMRIQMFP